MMEHSSRYEQAVHDAEIGSRERPSQQQDPDLEASARFPRDLYRHPQKAARLPEATISTPTRSWSAARRPSREPRSQGSPECDLITVVEEVFSHCE